MQKVILGKIRSAGLQKVILGKIRFRINAKLKTTLNYRSRAKTALNYRRGGPNDNLPFRWQRPLGKSIFVIFCCGIRRDEEKETQNINVVGKMFTPKTDQRES